MNHSQPAFARRKFLKYSLLGLGGVVGIGTIGAGIFLSNSFRNNYGKLLVLDGHLADIAHAFAEAALPQGNGFPSIKEATVVQRMDEELFFIDPNIQSDFKAVLYLVEAMPLLEGRFSRFSRLSREQRIAFLEQMQATTNDLYRVAIANARMVVRLMYYGHPSTWKAIGYDGPFGNIPEVLSEQRRYYASLVK
ncbi:MAG: hypothetical protein U0Y10_02765 [Spirosomataceae bacterium]